MSDTPAYRYLLCDLLTDKLLADVPLSGVTFDRRISRAGSLSGTLEAPTQRLVDVGRLLYENAGRSALWVLRDGQLWWGGVPWTVQASQGERGPLQVNVTAATFDSYAAHRILRADLTYTQVDQAQIMHGLWDHLQQDTRGNIGMVTDPTAATGTLRDRTYLASDQAAYGKLIEDLGDVEGGAEHTVDVYLDGYGNRVKRLRVANRLGSSTPRVVFQRVARGGGRVLQWTDTADAVDGGTTFQARGDAPNGNVGEEVQPLLSDVHEASTLLAAGWPLLDVTEDHSGVSDKATLDSWAAGSLEQYAGHPTTQSYQVQVGNTGWNPNRLGESVRLKLADAWHATGADLTIRPVGCKVTAASSTAPETVELIMGDEDA